MLFLKILSLLCSISLSNEVIITIDDFPFQWGRTSASNRLQRYSTIFMHHNVRGVVYFVNKGLRKEDLKNLEDHYIANHSYEHFHIKDNSLDKITKSIEQNYEVLKEKKNYLHIYRPPFLDLGKSKIRRDYIQFLVDEEYLAGHVNIDTLDWLWNSAVELSKFDQASKLLVGNIIQEIKEEWSGSAQPAVIMLHDRDFLAFYLDYFLKELKRNNIKVVDGKSAFSKFEISNLRPIKKFSPTYMYQQKKKEDELLISNLMKSEKDNWKVIVREAFNWIFLKL